MSTEIKKISDRKKILMAAKALSEKITEKTIAAGLTYKDIQKDVYQIYLDLKSKKNTTICTR